MKIDLHNPTHMQVLHGWGASSCWWSQMVKNPETAQQLAQVLYGKEGLKLNIYRYNIGGGFDEKNCRIENPWRKTESLYTFDVESESGAFDFSRDAAAQNVMDICLATGNIDTVILFANSPHYAHTATGQASGSYLYHTCNLPKSNYRKFADYILTVTQYFLDKGVPVRYISPINEPQWKWGGPSIWQEGCHFETEELVEVFHIFAEEIQKRGIPVKLYGPESGEMGGKTKEYLDALTADETIMQALEVFAYHSYHADCDVDARFTFKRELVTPTPALRFEMSEWCELPNKSPTDSIKGALITARVIGQDLIYGGSESWTAWVAVNQTDYKEENHDYSDGLLSAADDFSEWYIAKRYYGMAHFSKYIPVGSTALDIGFLPQNENRFNAFAFVTPQAQTVLVFVNEGEEETVTLNREFTSMHVVESTQSEQLKTCCNGAFQNRLTLPRESLTTVILK